MNKAKKYWKLFTTCFYISTFTFGGGFVIIPLMRRRFVEDLKWLEENEMMDLTAIAQSSPGAIAVNAAILTGFKIGSVAGAMIAMLATVLPPVIIITVISFFYNAFRENAVVGAVMKGMQAGVAAVICDVVIRMGSGVFKEKNALFVIIMAAAFILTFFLDVNVIFIILGCILLSVCIFLFKAAAKSKKRRKSLSKNVNPTSLAPSDGEQDAAQKEEQALKSSAREAEPAQGKQASEDKPLSGGEKLTTGKQSTVTEQTLTPEHTEKPEQKATPEQTAMLEQTATPAEDSGGKQTATSEHTENTEHTATPEQSTVSQQTLTLDKTGNTEQTLAPEHTENPEQKATPEQTAMLEQTATPEQSTVTEQTATLEQTGNTEQTATDAEDSDSKQITTPEKKELDSPKEKAAPKKTVGKSGKSVSPSEREKEREK